MRARTTAAFIPLVLLTVYYIYGRLAIFGAFRTTTNPVSQYALSGQHFVFPGTYQAEDLHLHEPSGLIITISEKTPHEKFGWFPAWAVFERPQDGLTSRGQIWAIDPTDWKIREIRFTNFDKPFNVHGFGIWPCEDNTTFYLHAVNHLPLMVDGEPTDEADSRIEVFKVDLKDMTATFERSIEHPLIKRPNDIFSLGPKEMLVTNDHYNSRGLLRSLEDFLDFSLASWTNIVHIKVERSVPHPDDHKVKGETQAFWAGFNDEVVGHVVADRLHNANGLGRGPHGEVILGDASGGKITTFTWSPETATLQNKHSIPVNVNLDNPVWFDDPYATPKSNASGYVLAGLLSGILLDHQARDPEARIPSAVYLAREGKGGKVEKTLLFEDDGEFMSGAATAIIVPVDPIAEADSAVEGQRSGWIVVSGPWSRAVGVVKVDLTEWAKTS